MNQIEQLYRIIWMSRPLMQSAEAVVEKGLAGTGLTVRMRAVLEILHRHGDGTVPDLASLLEINRQYVQLMVNETMASGFTERRPNPRHKKSSLVALTASGQSLIETVIAQEKALLDAIATDIDPAEVEAALKVVTKLAKFLKTKAEEQQQ